MKTSFRLLLLFVFASTLAFGQSPTAPAQGFNLFTEGNVTFQNSGDIEGATAIGGDLFLSSGNYNLSIRDAGNFTVAGDSRPTALMINGRIHYQGGNPTNVNSNGWVKLCNQSGSSIFSIDPNGATVNTQITSGSYNSNPRIQLQTNQPSNKVSGCNLINFSSAFNTMRATSSGLSGCANTLNPTFPGNPNAPNIFLASGKNVWNISGSDLNYFNELNFQNTPDANKYLVINVNVSGTFNWNSQFNMNGIGDQQGAFILWNFYNASSINITTSSTIKGTIFAPNASVSKNNSANIDGQVIATSYQQTGGELHGFPFTPNATPCGGGCNVTVNTSKTDATCGQNNGSVSAVGRGASSYTYVWVNNKRA